MGFITINPTSESNRYRDRSWPLYPLPLSRFSFPTPFVDQSIVLLQIQPIRLRFEFRLYVVGVEELRLELDKKKKEREMPEEDLVELKFRLYDGTDIGPFQYSPMFTVAMLKERIVTEWPKDKKIAPKAANDIKLISAGKILENTVTVGQCKAPFGEVITGVITMHVVVQPTITKSKTEKKVDEEPNKGVCSCTVI